MKEYDEVIDNIKQGNFEKVVQLVEEKAFFYGEAGSCICEVFEHSSLLPSQELLDRLFQHFLKKRWHQQEYHGLWVHSLSHFIRDLWRHRQTRWIKIFHEAAFLGANELGDTNCCDQLVYDYLRLADWNDNPVDFHITYEKLGWYKKRNNGSWAPPIEERILKGNFSTEDEFIRWKLVGLLTSCGEGENYLWDADYILDKLLRLSEVTKLELSEREMISNIETRVNDFKLIKSQTKDWNSYVQEKIAQIRKKIVKLKKI